MISFLWRKIIKNRWLTLSLLFGNILLIGIVTATPLFVTATMQRVFQEDMRRMRHDFNTHPALMQMSFTFNREAVFCHSEVYRYSRWGVWPEVQEKLDVTPVMSVRSYRMHSIWAGPYIPRENNPRGRRLTFVGMEGFEYNVEITHGRLPSPYLVNGNIMEVIATEVALERTGMMLGEVWYFHSAAFGGLKFQVVGVYAIAQGSEMYWSILPCIEIVDPDLPPDMAARVRSLIGIDPSTHIVAHYNFIHYHLASNYSPIFNLTAFFTQALDFNEMHVLDAVRHNEAIQSVHDRTAGVSAGLVFRNNFQNTMNNSIERTRDLPVTLWILQIPLYVMMALYIYMVSRKILEMDKNDVAVLSSRGASRRQIIGMYVWQGLFIGAVSFVIGLALGVVVCQLIGSSNGFLELVAREALEIRITGQALLYGFIAAMFSFLTMLIPVINFSKVGIHDHKISKRKKAVWQRYFIDVLCAGVAIYGLYNFNNQQELMATQIREVQSVDPILFANSSLFIFGISLLCLRIFPYFMKLVFLIGRRFFSPSIYASMLKVIRSAGEEQFIMLFLVFTIAVGIFSAQVARTINLNNDHRIMYVGGTDLVFMEHTGPPGTIARWRDNIPPVCELTGAFLGPIPRNLIYTEPDFGRFLNFEEVDHMTRVMRQTVTLRRGAVSTVEEMQMLGIETYSFGNTSWFRYDLLPLHINYYLNTLGSVPNGVLLSDNFRTVLDYEIGQLVTIMDIYCPTNRPIPHRPPQNVFKIIGFVEHWPSMPPRQREELSTGETIMTEPFFAIVNFAYIHVNWGIRPYEIWMQTNTDSAQFFTDFVADNPMRFYRFYDTVSELAAIRTDPIVLGMNGILTMSFITTLLVSLTGFLIYWILSIKARVLQFGIFRAMGLSMRNIISLLVNEQIFITLTALGLGAAVGAISARLFVPIIQVSYTAAEQVLPLVRVMKAGDYRNLYSVLGITIVLCLLVLGAFISKINITQALKLGED